jgi:hypothetical protein
MGMGAKTGVCVWGEGLFDEDMTPTDTTIDYKLHFVPTFI